jgi:hypothetical protein
MKNKYTEEEIFELAFLLDQKAKEERKACVESIELLLEGLEFINESEAMKEGCELARGAVEIRYYTDDEEENI